MTVAHSSGASSSPREQRQMIEWEVIQRICVGEKELYYELIRPYERSVYLTCLAILNNEADAEEVAQEAFLKAFRALSSFRGEARFSTWLDRIAVNESRMRLREQRRGTVELLEEDHDSESLGYSPLLLSDWRLIPSEELEAKEVRAILNRAMLQLPNKDREIVILRDIQNRSINETAELLQVTPGTVKTRLLRARLRLRDLVAPLLKNAVVSSRNPFKKGRNPW